MYSQSTITKITESEMMSWAKLIPQPGKRELKVLMREPEEKINNGQI
jgi:hypothetical protein